MNSTLLFFATLSQVFMISAQNIHIIKHNYLLASICSTLVAVSNIFVLKIVPDATNDALISYVVANSIAVPLAMFFCNRKKIKL